IYFLERLSSKELPKVKDPPRKGRPTTGAQHDLEHLVIFLATGMAFGFGYPDRFRLPTIIAQPTFAAAIEVAQIWAPGRRARMSDFLVDAAASCLGVGLSYAFVRLKRGFIRSDGTPCAPPAPGPLPRGRSSAAARELSVGDGSRPFRADSVFREKKRNRRQRRTRSRLPSAEPLRASSPWSPPYD